MKGIMLKIRSLSFSLIFPWHLSLGRQGVHSCISQEDPQELTNQGLGAFEKPRSSRFQIYHVAQHSSQATHCIALQVTISNSFLP